MFLMASYQRALRTVTYRPADFHSVVMSIAVISEESLRDFVLFVCDRQELQEEQQKQRVGLNNLCYWLLSLLEKETIGLFRISGIGLLRQASTSE